MVNHQDKLDRLSSFVIRHRASIVLSVFMVWCVVAFGAVKIKTEVILKDLFPYDHPYLKLHTRFSKVFGGGGFGVVIAVNAKQGDIFNQRTLGKVKEITDKLLLTDELYRVLTVSIATNSTKVVKTKSKGEIVIDALMFPEIPGDDKEMGLLKRYIFSNPSYNGTLVSADGTAALIFTQVREYVSYDRIFRLFRGIVNDYEDEETSVHIVGFPMLMGWIYSYKAQMLWVFGTSVALMLIILFLVFRNLVGMIAPFIMVVICTGLGLGFIGWTGVNFSPLLYVLAFLVGARMLSNAVQITHRYIQEYRDCSTSEEPRRTAAFNTMRTMIMPNAAAVATDAAGFMVLGLAKIVLMQQVAIIMTFWMLTIILEGIMVPIICSYLPRLGAPTSNNTDKTGFLDKATKSIADFSMTRGKHLIGLVAIMIVIFGVWQTTHLKIGDPTPGSPILWPNHPYNQDQALINKRFDASSETFMLFYEGKPQSVYDPIVPKTFEAFARHMANRLPDIYKSSSSINNLGKMINLTFHDGHYLWYQIPRDPKLLTGLLGYVRQNIDRGTLGRFMDTTQERAQMTLFFSDHTSDNMLRIREAAYDFFRKHSMKTEHGQFHLAGGAIGLEIAVNEEMKRAHILMDSMVLVTIFIMCTVSFRSFVAGGMLTLPLILSNLVAFAYMALTGIGLSTNTLPCAAVGVGVGVDFSIYLYSRCVEEFSRSQDFHKTVSIAAQTTGKGILFTGLTLILPILLWYYISALKFQAQMGFFLSMLLFTNLIAAFTLHPLLIILIKPRFMQKRGAANEIA